jgi:hypothetical protein
LDKICPEICIQFESKKIEKTSINASGNKQNSIKGHFFVNLHFGPTRPFGPAASVRARWRTAQRGPVYAGSSFFFVLSRNEFLLGR